MQELICADDDVDGTVTNNGPWVEGQDHLSFVLNFIVTYFGIWPPGIAGGGVTRSMLVRM